jgi:hypothetical protein
MLSHPTGRSPACRPMNRLSYTTAKKNSAVSSSTACSMSRYSSIPRSKDATPWVDLYFWDHWFCCFRKGPFARPTVSAFNGKTRTATIISLTSASQDGSWPTICSTPLSTHLSLKSARNWPKRRPGGRTEPHSWKKNNTDSPPESCRLSPAGTVPWNSGKPTCHPAVNVLCADNDSMSIRADNSVLVVLIPRCRLRWLLPYKADTSLTPLHHSF